MEEPHGSGEEDVSQGAVWCSAFCGPACSKQADRQLHTLGGTNKGIGPLGLLKTVFVDEFSHPQNTQPSDSALTCSELFSKAKMEKVKLKYSCISLGLQNVSRVLQMKRLECKYKCRTSCYTYSLVGRSAGQRSSRLPGKQPDKDTFH